MKFLVDAHLPRRLSTMLNAVGHNAVHTLDLAEQNRTKDSVINQISLDQYRVVITKDSDFRDSHLIKGEPYKLLLVATGNISNNDLIRLFEQNLERIVEMLETCTFVEMGRHHLTIHQ